MSAIGEKFNKLSAKVVSKFASKAILNVPSGGDYDPRTGNTVSMFDTYDVEYVDISDSTRLTENTTASSFRDRIIYFTLPSNISIDETAWITDVFGVEWDIVALDKINVGDVVVGYNATIKTRL